MYHQLVPDGGGDYDLSPVEFRRELDRLWREGYRPVRASDLVNGTIDIPRGTTPVVMTFDDATASQAALTDSGRLDPDSAAGILVDFAKSHPGFGPAATFFVNREPFAAEDRTSELIDLLVGLGFEIANHTRDHLALGTLSAEEVQQQLVLGNRVIHDYLPAADVTTMALPLGSVPQRPELALQGAWDGEQYRFKGVFLVGAEPAPSPFSKAFEPGAIPRVRSTADRGVENGSADWLDRLSREPALRYVSDGDPSRITVPAGSENDVATRFRERVHPR
jgi:peptidoglycan/xylan/chitin deacetylase (PgdA/CDA1 family)